MIEKKTPKQMRLEIEDYLPIIEECQKCKERTLIESCDDLVSLASSIYPRFICAHCGHQTITKMSNFLMGRRYEYSELMPMTVWRHIRIWLKIKLRLVPLVRVDASVENWGRKNFAYGGIERDIEEEKERQGLLGYQRNARSGRSVREEYRYIPW